MSHKKFIVFSLVFASLVVSHCMAQIRISSPYSRYGLGDLQNSYLRNLSLGGISIGIRDSSEVNYANPASYTSFDTNSFVFETGLNSLFTQLSSNTQSQSSNYTSLAYLLFGFPVTKWWGVSIGLLPFSNVGYNISDYETIDSIGKVKYSYEGSGGLNQFYMGHAFRVKNFSIGMNAAYIFGVFDKTRTISFPDSTTKYLATRLQNSTQVNDFLFTFGLQYVKKFNKNLKIKIGFVYDATASLKAKQDSLGYNEILATTGEAINKDTTVNSERTKGVIKLPRGFGFGLSMEKNAPKSGRWIAGADFKMQNWKNYSAFGETDSLKNSWQASVGAEFIPKNTAVSNYFRRIHYRIGARYDKTYLSLHDTQLSEYAVSFGFGLPLKRSASAINVGFELGQRGTLDNNLIKEQFFRVVLSLSVYEFWFYKSKYE